MKKIGSILIIAVIVGLAVAGLVYSTNNVLEENKTTFERGGYIVLTDANAESNRVFFAQDAVYKISAEDEIVFNDIEESQYSVEQDTFFHFDGDYISPLVEGVFMDLSEVGSDFVTCYHTDPGMLIENSGKVKVSANSQSYDFDSIIWKLNDDHYIILGNNLSAVFSSEDVRTCGNYVELNYLDRGVVQIITEDNVWQTASSECYIQVGEDVQVYPILEQMINTATGRESFMNAMVVDSDDNMHLRNEQEKNVNNIIPHFNVITKDGENGTSGKSGESGDLGSDGKKGSQGAWGADAGTTSSSKTEIPTMLITDWKVSATTVMAGITVTDTSDALENDSFVSGDTVYVQKVGSSERISVYPCVSSDYKVVDSKFSSLANELTQYVKLDPEVQLEPDSEYVLVIRGQYSMGDYDTKSTDGANAEGSTIYRDFIYRTFYTDSLGVMISKNAATTSTVSLNVDKQSYSKATSVTVFLLTEDQNIGFDEDTAIDEVTHYSGDYFLNTITYSDSEKDTYTNTLSEFGVVNSGQALEKDKQYVARILISYEDDNGDVIQKLSRQECYVQTLKTIPTLTGIPTVASNRVNKCFEVYSATVADPDNAITAYIYEVYTNAATGSESSLIKTIELSPDSYAASEYYTLYIDDESIFFNKEYYVVEKLRYNDNEKDVEIELNSSNAIAVSSVFSMVGSQLPSVTFRYLTDSDGNNIGRHYDRIQGWLVISKNGSSIRYGADNPITVYMQAEGIFDKQMIFTTEDVKDTGNDLLIYIDEKALYRDTIYRMTVSAEVDVNDDGDTDVEQYVGRIIGNIVVSTSEIPELKAVWSASSSSGHAVSRKLTLVAANEGEDISYVANTLTSITIELYSGSYGSGYKLSEYPLKDTDDREYVSILTQELFEDGLDLDESTFGKEKSSMTASSYSFVITSCYDYTYENANGDNPGNICKYANEITIKNYDSGTIGAEKQPPNLPDYGSEDTCITATALTRKQAVSKYGLDMSDVEGDDTVVGYTLQANYDNFSNLARSVIYYGFEANYFRSKYLQGIDPVNAIDSGILFEVELGVDLNSNVIPSLVVLFGTDPEEDDSLRHIDGDVFTIKNQYMIYAGEDVTNGDTLTAGMGRGYIYCFEYRVNYSSTGGETADKVYPTNAAGYDTWNATEGHNYKPAMVLRSPYMFAPKTLPTFESYPLSTSYGVLDFAYRYVDPDGLVVSTGTNMSKFTVNGTESSVVIAEDSACSLLDDSCVWQTAEVTGVKGILDNSTGSYVATIGLTGNPYKLNYNVEDYDITTDSQSIIVYKTPWNNSVLPTYDGDTIKVDISATTETLDTNYLTVSLTLNSNETINPLENLVGVILDFKCKLHPDKTFSVFCEFEQTATGLIANVPLSNFANYLGESLQCTARVIYDSGKFGWEVVKGSVTSYTALQRIDNLAFGQYITKSINSTSIIDSDYAINSYFTMTPRTYIREDDNTTQLYYIATSEKNSTTNFVYGYSNHGLVSINDSNNGIVPKILSEVTVSSKNVKIHLDEGVYSFVISSIIPTASSPSVSTQMTTAYLYNLKINGADQITVDKNNGNKRFVTIELYEVLDSYGNTKLVQTIEKEVSINSDNTGTVSGFTIEGIKKETDYILKYYCKTGTKGNLKSIINENSTSGEALTTNFTTNKAVYIYNARYTYVNTDYKNKSYELSYRISQTKGIKIQYTIYREEDRDGVVGYYEYLSHQELVDMGIIEDEDTDNYNSDITKTFKILTTNNPFTPGEKYAFQISIYDSTTFNETEHTGDLVSKEDQGSVTFVHYQSLYPTTNIKVTPTYSTMSDLTKQFGFDFEVTAIADDGLIVIGPANGNYGVRIYELTSDGYELLTDKEGITLTKVDGKTSTATTLSALYSNVYSSTVGTGSYNIIGLDPSKYYKFEVYAAIDMDYNGKNDFIATGSSYEGYISMSYGEMIENENGKALFDSDANFRECYLLNETIKMTPDEYGLSVGYISARTDPFNSSQIQLQFFDSSGLSNINKVVMSIIHESGSPALSSRDGVITTDVYESMFEYDESTDVTNFTIPTSKFAAGKSGTYTINVKFYIVKDDSETLAYSYSGKMVK